MSLTRFAILCIIFVSLFGVHACENVEAFEENNINLSNITCSRGICTDLHYCFCCIKNDRDCYGTKDDCVRECTKVYGPINTVPKKNGASKALGLPILPAFLMAIYLFCF
ncbi:hypothetical protein ARALYDRAFT_915185 [Arabidopsis lyrata subsp. lyrata]|uniref:Embryo surrounding factor 1 brassicaceae domain-containing protein n=1 Tax=Arabidopsis lyrata subsp. lyrata TaxID=81972 RepID=D7MAA7_ARALL|nr:hypothetical protein ARALYDRAFT_915185 [Arabidopsis lyrata subsp. lyrata]